MSNISSNPLSDDNIKIKGITGENILGNFPRALKLFLHPDTLNNVTQEQLNKTYESLTEFIETVYSRDSKVEAVIAKHFVNNTHIPLKSFSTTEEINRIWLCIEVALKLLQGLKENQKGELANSTIDEEKLIQLATGATDSSSMSIVDTVLSRYDVDSLKYDHGLRVETSNVIERNFFLVEPVGHVENIYGFMQDMFKLNIDKESLISAYEETLDAINDKTGTALHHNLSIDKLDKLEHSAMILHVPKLFPYEITDSKVQECLTHFQRGLTPLQIPHHSAHLNCLPLILTILDGRIGVQESNKIIDYCISKTIEEQNATDSCNMVDFHHALWEVLMDLDEKSTNMQKAVISDLYYDVVKNIRFWQTI